MKAAKKFYICFLSIFTAAVVAPTKVSADYEPPTYASTYFFVTDNWALEKNSELSKSFDKLVVKYKKRTLSWSLDDFDIANAMDGNSICGGYYEESVKLYMSELAAEPKHPPVVVEVVREKPLSKPKIAAIWRCDFDDMYRKNSGMDNLLDMTPDKTRQISSAKEYEQQIRIHSDRILDSL